MSETQLFTSESVSMGHPDKVSDQISDAILDAMLKNDPYSRVAVETMVSTGMAVIAGEVTTEGYVDIPEIVRGVIRDIGYNDGDMRFDAESCAVMVSINQQSPDIAQGVNKEGAGDQGMMFGFACKETDELMPLPLMLSHKLVAQQAHVRENGQIPGLRPDAKSQVTVEYDHRKPVRVDTVVISTQHDKSWNEKQDQLKREVIEHIIKPVLVACADGGGRGRHGGGAFSGKDPTKVDRSAAYMARYIAKNVVAADLADECEIQLSYAIGVAEPTSIYVETFGTAKVDEKALADAVRDTFPLTPRGIIETLDLRKPIYQPTARHGHFGRQPIEKGGLQFFPWEMVDRAEALKAACKDAVPASA